MFFICIVQLVNHLWLLSPWNVASVAEEPNIKFYLILMNLILNGHTWLMRKGRLFEIKYLAQGLMNWKE